MKNRIYIYLVVLIVCSACQHATKNPDRSQQSAPTPAAKLALISINDVYRIAGIDNGQTGGLARVRALREQIEAEYKNVLFLHAGDFLHPSFISKQDGGSAMIKTMNMLDGAAEQFDERMLVTWGNHEFDKSGIRHVPMMNELLAASEFTWLDSNIQWQADTISSERMQKYKLFQFNEFTVGVFSYTTDIVHPEYIDSFIGYAATAEHYVPMLRAQGADFVIGLTHQWLQDDLAMMALPEAFRPDIIFGGHEHYAQTEQVNGNWVLKADADAASALVVEVTFEPTGYQVFPQLVPLNSEFPEAPEVTDLVQSLSLDNDTNYCLNKGLSSDCLDEVLGTTNNQLIAEETEIRRFETNLGNTLADLALAEFNKCQADIVLLNSGSIRLNQNIPANSDITIKHLEEMFPYPSDLRLIEFDSTLLPEILAHAISSWTANGHWLQIAGFVFIHNPELQTAEHIHLKGQAHNESIKNRKVRAVVPYYLISDDTDHDGYEMLNSGMQRTCEANGAQIKNLFKQHLKSLPSGLNSNRDFRICNTVRDTCH